MNAARRVYYTWQTQRKAKGRSNASPRLVAPSHLMLVNSTAAKPRRLKLYCSRSRMLHPPTLPLVPYRISCCWKQGGTKPFPLLSSGLVSSFPIYQSHKTSFRSVRSRWTFLKFPRVYLPFSSQITPLQGAVKTHARPKTTQGCVSTAIKRINKAARCD